MVEYKGKIFDTVPNQKVIEINKAPCDKQHYYARINLSALDKASQTLETKGGFKLWIYLSKNQDKYTFALSSSDFMEWSGLSKSAYDTAMKELINKGYLKQTQAHKAVYEFCENPDNTDKQEQENSQVLLEPGFTF